MGDLEARFPPPPDIRMQNNAIYQHGKVFDILFIGVKYYMIHCVSFGVKIQGDIVA